MPPKPHRREQGLPSRRNPAYSNECCRTPSLHGVLTKIRLRFGGGKIEDAKIEDVKIEDAKMKAIG
jgi:hypothetical protein